MSVREALCTSVALGGRVIRSTSGVIKSSIPTAPAWLNMANQNDLGRRVATAEHCLVAHPRTGVTPAQPSMRKPAMNNLSTSIRSTDASIDALWNARPCSGLL
jgi:hypothetical protein